MTMPMTAPYEPGGSTVTVVRAALATDARYGRQYRDWTDVTETPIRGVSVQPISHGDETDVQREYAATHLRMFAPFTALVESTDRIVWAGVTYEVDGEPARWYDDAGQPDHIEVDIKRMTG